MAMSVAGQGVTAVRRVYRSPKHAAANPASWLYLVETEVGVEEAKLSDYLSSLLLHELNETQLVEAYPAEAVLPTYHYAALAASKLLWPYSVDDEHRSWRLCWWAGNGDVCLTW